jgi:trimethylamine--corrinoid protein Co-methyltransferase
LDQKLIDPQNLGRLKLLTDDQIEALKRAALAVMINAGFKVCHVEARHLLKKAGAIVRGEIVKVPQDIVEACLANAPKGWTIYNREGQEALNVYGRNSYFGTSTGAPNTMDSISGKVRPTCYDDIKQGALLADALQNIDFVMPFGSAQDVPGSTADLYEFEAIIANTTKPVAVLTSSGKALELVVEMASAATGGLTQFQQKPFLIAFPVHLSPLVFPEKACERLLTAAVFGIPQVPSSAVQMGATGPITVAGSVALALAEGLFCIVLAQLKNPGCPVALAANFTILDMSTSLVSIGAPSISVAYGMHAEVAQSYGLPTWGLAGATDSKAIDAQAGIEATFHLFAQALAGVNLIHDVGYVDSAMSCSPLQLLMGNEIIGMIRHYLNDVKISKDTLATEVINTVGPGGQFLTHQHTLHHLRNSFWQPSILNRHPRPQWERNGAKTLEDTLRERMRAISDTHKPKPLNLNSIIEIERIKRRGEKTLLKN